MQKSCKSSSGRMRRKLYRIHSKAPQISAVRNVELEFPINFPQITESVNSTIFQNIVISPDALKQKLPSYSKKDTTNLEVNDAIKNLTTENVIHKRKKIPFHEVVSSAKEFLQKREKEKKKAKKEILSNFSALEEALPTLNQLMEKKVELNGKPRLAKSFAKQDAEMMEDIQTYQQVLKNVQCTVDPIGTITEQLKQRIESGCL